MSCETGGGEGNADKEETSEEEKACKEGQRREVRMLWSVKKGSRVRGFRGSRVPEKNGFVCLNPRTQEPLKPIS
jgi:hypothetical protein